jgi:hypothetical protein
MATVYTEKNVKYNKRNYSGNTVEQRIAHNKYMTLEEFRVEAKASLTKILNSHSITDWICWI